MLKQKAELESIYVYSCRLTFVLTFVFPTEQ